MVVVDSCPAIKVGLLHKASIGTINALPPCVIEDLLDYVRVSNPKAAPSDDTHSSATHRA